MNQGKLEVVKQEMARVNIDILGISELKWTAATAKSLQLCPTLCDPIDSNPPGSSVRGIRQARILEWVAISFAQCMLLLLLLLLLSRFSCVQLCVTP